ncbi:hypothetical protein C2845_PM11G27510 [Panicum miliaceum]|uniref:Uncharacterized protein n=1 Tax=Panicum miliaceum TaxID=4540 RepID=A0A3L6RSU4_PANMI|nr:hypothetical protein C2845_PM11G27510 [Panicum miliaceum]
MVPKNPLKKLEQMVLLATLQQLVDAARAMVASLSAKLTYQRKKQDKSVAAEQNQKGSQQENDKESGTGSKKGHTKTCPMPTWFETWERADTYAALAVVAAAASAFVAFRIYKNLN